MNLKMDGLKINQKILADSTCYFSDSQVIELCPTTLIDAVNTQRGIVIELGGGHNWGACPDRSRDRVVAKAGDIKPFFDMKISRKEGLEERLKAGKSLLRVYQNPNNKELYVEEFSFSQKVDSLKDGKYTEFKKQSSFMRETLKVYGGNIPHGFYTTLEDTFKEFERIAEMLL
jgi:hypothetical protein